MSPFVILGKPGLFCRFYSVFFLLKIVLANNVDPDQTPHDVASDLGLHYSPMTLYGFQGKNGLNEWIQFCVRLRWHRVIASLLTSYFKGKKFSHELSRLIIGRTHGARYRGYGYVPLRFVEGGGGGTSLGEWEHNNNNEG